MSKTKSGFEYTVDPRILTDWRFTMAVAKIQTGTDLEKMNCVGEMLNLLLGNDQQTKLMEHIAKKNDGFVPAEAIMAEVTEIITKESAAKN